MKTLLSKKNIRFKSSPKIITNHHKRIKPNLFPSPVKLCASFTKNSRFSSINHQQMFSEKWLLKNKQQFQQKNLKKNFFQPKKNELGKKIQDRNDPWRTNGPFRFLSIGRDTTITQHNIDDLEDSSSDEFQKAINPGGKDSNFSSFFTKWQEENNEFDDEKLKQAKIRFSNRFKNKGETFFYDEKDEQSPSQILQSALDDLEEEEEEEDDKFLRNEKISDTRTNILEDEEPVDYDEFKDFLDPGFQQYVSKKIQNEQVHEQAHPNPYRKGDAKIRELKDSSIFPDEVQEQKKSTMESKKKTQNRFTAAISDIFVERKRMAYFLKKNHEKVEIHFKRLPFPDSNDYAILIRSFLEGKRYDKISHLWEILRNSKFKLSPFTCFYILEGLCKASKIDLTIEVLSYIKGRNFTLYPHVLKHISNFKIFNHMPKEEITNFFEYFIDNDLHFKNSNLSFLVNALSSANQEHLISRLVSQIEKREIIFTSLLYNELLKVYVKFDNQEQLENIFKEMIENGSIFKKKNQNEENQIYFFKRNYSKRPVGIYQQSLKEENNPYPDTKTYSLVIDYFLKKKQKEKALEYFSYLFFDILSAKINGKVDLELINNILKILRETKSLNEIPHVIAALEILRIKPTTETWSTIVSSYNENFQDEKVFFIWRYIQKRGIPINEETLKNIFQSTGKLGRLREVFSIWTSMKRTIQFTKEIFQILLEIYAPFKQYDHIVYQIVKQIPRNQIDCEFAYMLITNSPLMDIENWHLENLTKIEKKKAPSQVYKCYFCGGNHLAKHCSKKSNLSKPETTYEGEEILERALQEEEDEDTLSFKKKDNFVVTTPQTLNQFLKEIENQKNAKLNQNQMSIFNNMVEDFKLWLEYHQETKLPKSKALKRIEKSVFLEFDLQKEALFWRNFVPPNGAWVESLEEKDSLNNFDPVADQIDQQLLEDTKKKLLSEPDKSKKVKTQKKVKITPLPNDDSDEDIDDYFQQFKI